MSETPTPRTDELVLNLQRFRNETRSFTPMKIKEAALKNPPEDLEEFSRGLERELATAREERDAAAAALREWRAGKTTQPPVTTP